MTCAVFRWFEVKFEPRPGYGASAYVKVIVKIIPMHMMIREINPGRQQRV